jgi:hypothetical protein
MTKQAFFKGWFHSLHHARMVRAASAGATTQLVLEQRIKKRPTWFWCLKAPESTPAYNGHTNEIGLASEMQTQPVSVSDREVRSNGVNESK